MLSLRQQREGRHMVVDRDMCRVNIFICMCVFKQSATHNTSHCKINRIDASNEDKHATDIAQYKHQQRRPGPLFNKL